MVFELSLERGGWVVFDGGGTQESGGMGWDGIGGCRRLGRVECERVSADV